MLILRTQDVLGTFVSSPDRIEEDCRAYCERKERQQSCVVLEFAERFDRHHLQSLVQFERIRDGRPHQGCE